jgi:hypothetical protein
LRIRQRIDHGEVVGTVEFLVARLRAGLLPGLRDRPALPLELVLFEPADPSIE